MVLYAVEVGKSGVRKKVRFGNEEMDVDGADEVGDPRVGGSRSWVGQETPASVGESGNGKMEGRSAEGEKGESVVFRRRVLP